jgi:Zn-dependent protease with chaperone function
MTDKSSYSSGKAALTLIVLPLVLLLISFWQLQRLPSIGVANTEVAALDAQLADLRAMAQEPRAWSKTVQTADGQHLGLALAIQRLEAARAEAADGGAFGPALPAILARVGVISSALVLLVAVAGLLFIRRMGRQAMASRSALLSAFSAGQSLLPVLLVISVAGMACAVLCVGSYELLQTLWQRTQTRGGMKLFVLAIVALGFMGYVGIRLIVKLVQASRQVFVREPLVIMGRVASAAEAPALWQLVREVANKVGAMVPAHIVVGLNEGFFVTEHPVRLASGQAVPAGRLLYLPLPYMAFLGKPEVTAIIGHELGHFMGEDTEYSLRFSPIYASARHHLGAIDAVRNDDDGAWGWFSKPALHLGEFFLHAFHDSVQYWSRQRELAADRVGAVQSGGEASALALLRSGVLAPRIDQALFECWQSGDQAGGGVLARTRELVRSEGLDSADIHLDDCQSHPTDSHPTTRQRIDALGVTVTPELLRRAQDPLESGLLQELGLDAGPVPAGAADTAAPALAQALESEFRATADAERRERIAFLTGLAAKGQETKAIYEGGYVAMIAVGIAALAAVVASVMVPTLGIGARSGLAGAGVAFIVIIVRTLRMRRSPVLTLSRDGILLAKLAKLLPWAEIHDIQAQVYSNTGVSMITVTFDLAGAATKEAFSGDRRVKVKDGNLIVSVQGVRKLSDDAFLETLHEYWQGGLARAELARLRQHR